jgi:hypothetical protein
MALALVATLVGTVLPLYAEEPEETHPDQDRASQAAGQENPRVIARADVGLLGLPNAGPQGGGGISVPIGGTGAGFLDSGGVELGAEVRASPWITFDLAAGRYRPELEVARYQGPDVRSGSVGLRTLTLGLVVTPPGWRTNRSRLALGLVVSRAEISSVPLDLGLSVNESETCVGFDVRGDVFVSPDRRWGFGGALAFVDMDPSFLDVETGDAGSLQVSGLFLKLGVRRAW